MTRYTYVLPRREEIYCLFSFLFNITFDLYYVGINNRLTSTTENR